MPLRRHPLPVAAAVALTPAWLENNAHATRTRNTYAAGTRAYEAWARASGLTPWQGGQEGAAVLQAYQGALAQSGVAPSTLRQRLAAVSWAYRRLYRLEPPTQEPAVRLSGRGAVRFAAAGHAVRQAAPLSQEQVARVLHEAPDSPDWLLTKALLSVMTCGALREGEAVGIQVAHLMGLEGGGFRVWLPTHKGGRDGTGVMQVIAAPTWAPAWDPTGHVQAWRAWAECGGEGPLFRGLPGGARARRANEGALSVRCVDRVVRKAARWLDLDAPRVSGHSPRSTWVCAALAAGVRPEDARRHTRHATVEMVLGYQRAFVGVIATRQPIG